MLLSEGLFVGLSCWPRDELGLLSLLKLVGATPVLVVDSFVAATDCSSGWYGPEGSTCSELYAFR